VSRSIWSPFVQGVIAFSALLVAGAAIIYAVAAWKEDKNARLVEIGVAILRADPKKEPTNVATREWALKLIDANAGGIKFSPQAREELLKNAIYGDIDLSANVRFDEPKKKRP